MGGLPCESYPPLFLRFKPASSLDSTVARAPFAERAPGWGSRSQHPGSAGACAVGYGQKF